MATHPEILWAQRSSETEEEKNILYFTINLPDVQENTIKYELTPTSISFAAKAGNASKNIAEKDYEFKLDFYEEVVPEQSKKRISSREIALILRKKEKKLEFWPRLTKEKLKIPFIKTDFSKWVDEDEQEGEALKPDDEFDMEGMGGMGGMGGMPGMGGMGGMGGMPGMGGMGGMPGMGGAGGMDIEAMLASMKAQGGGPKGDGDEEGTDSDDEGPPPLEDA
ncbi:hypothetical protein FRC01_014141 [Tulasnella sp. 417]|nr:hypothetical protein FRC01_014141 [Tulasnella sp. 417]